MIIGRKVDNDVDSDDENMYAGMGYLYRELLERVNQNRKWFQIIDVFAWM